MVHRLLSINLVLHHHHFLFIQCTLCTSMVLASCNLLLHHTPSPLSSLSPSPSLTFTLSLLDGSCILLVKPSDKIWSDNMILAPLGHDELTLYITLLALLISSTFQPRFQLQYSSPTYFCLQRTFLTLTLILLATSHSFSDDCGPLQRLRCWPPCSRVCYGSPCWTF